MTTILAANPKPGSLQAEFESIMIRIGWMRGALAIHADGSGYLSEDVDKHWQAFIENSF